MNYNSSNVIHVIVDMLYDFIDGSLACKNAFSAMEKTIEYINSNPDQKVLYVCDCHPSNHCSFIENGGTWPPHCVEGTEGQKIYDDFFTKVKNEASRPNPDNIFFKGKNRSQEQYSSFNSSNNKGETLGSYIAEFHKANKDSIVIMSGIATEFCIKESLLDLLGSGNNVNIIVQDLAYVNFNGHLESLKILKEKGAILI